jgi:hypothetical protein
MRPHAENSVYIAATLPQIFFEAELFDELVELALSRGSLPRQANKLQSQEIELARARYAWPRCSVSAGLPMLR